MLAVRPIAAGDPQGTRAGLERGCGPGARAFIATLDADYDRALRIGELLDVHPGNDLSIAAGEGCQERWVMAQRLAWDSEFFHRGIARLDALIDPAGAPELRADVTPMVETLTAWFSHASAAGIDYAFAMADAVDLPAIRALTGAGFELIETRVHHHMALTPASERYATRLATSVDISSLAQAAATEINPFDRFHADPEVSSADADRLMREWVRASIDGTFADLTVVPDVVAPEAFSMARMHREHWDGWGLRLSQPVLSAVTERHRGWYFRILSDLHERLREQGADHVVHVTQLTNGAVLRTWEKLGYRFGKGEHVFRRVIATET